MSNPKEFKTLKLELARAAMYISHLVSAILGRTITCKAASEDNEYWSVAAINDRFSASELMRLIQFVEGDAAMCRSVLPIETNSSKSLDMSLAQALLKKATQLDWEREFVTPDALWLVGCWRDEIKPPEFSEDLLFIGSIEIPVKQLWQADDLVQHLFQYGGNYSALVELCDRYQEHFGNELFWHYPMTDGKYTGVYFILVQEGVLAISYDEVTEYDHEIFVRDSVKICSAEDLNWFILDWKRNEASLMDALETMAFYLEKKEEDAAR